MYKERIKDCKRKEQVLLTVTTATTVPTRQNKPFFSPSSFFLPLFSFSLVHASSPKGTGADQRPNDYNSKKSPIPPVPSQPTFLCDRRLPPLPFPSCVRPPRSYNLRTFYPHEAASALPLTDLEFGKRERRAKKQRKEQNRESRVVHLGRRKGRFKPSRLDSYIHPTSHEPA